MLRCVSNDSSFLAQTGAVCVKMCHYWSTLHYSIFFAFHSVHPSVTVDHPAANKERNITTETFPHVFTCFDIFDRNNRTQYSVCILFYFIPSRFVSREFFLSQTVQCQFFKLFKRAFLRESCILTLVLKPKIHYVLCLL